MSENEWRLATKSMEYAAFRQIEIAECLGWGIHGSVWKVSGKTGTFPWALKMFRHAVPYRRERDCYLRLREMDVDSIGGIAIPVLIAMDDDWLAIEMSLVARPFLLDFGSAWLDERPDFPPEVWEQAEADAAEKFGDDWPVARRMIESLEEQCGIIMGDVHPGNLALR